MAQDDEKTTAEQQDTGESVPDVSAELFALKEEYERRITALSADLEREKAAHVRDVKNFLLNGKNATPDVEKTQDELDDEFVASQRARLQKLIR